MKLSSFMHAGAFVLLSLIVVLSFRWLFPNNHAYGSIALVVFAAAFACVTKSNTVTILLCGVAYLAFMVFDSLFGIWLLTGPKASESIIFPIVSTVIVTAFLFLGLGVKKYVLHRAGSKNH